MRKLLAVILSVAMMVTFMPTLAFAADSPISLTGATVSDIADQIYTGSPIDPKITVTQGNQDVPPSGYNVTYTTTATGDNTKHTAVGTVTMTITGNGISYKDSITKEFKILPKDLKQTSYNGIPSQGVGTTISDSLIVIRDGSKTLIKGTDYNFAASPTTAGPNTLILTGAGNYNGTLNINYFGATDISSYTISTTQYSSYKYDGIGKKCNSVTVTANNGLELSTSYYDVTYTGNIKVGDSPQITITGKNGYAGTKTQSAGFTITPKPISECTIDNIDNPIVGEKPVVTVRDGNKVLVKGQDFDIDTTATDSVLIYGLGNYGDRVTRSYTTGLSITGANVILSDQSYIYDGYAKTPTVTVKLNGNNLVLNKDYKLQYLNNINGSDSPNNASIKIIGINTYAGTIEKTFTIEKKDISLCNITTSGTSFEYTGYAIEPTVTIRDTYVYLTKGKDYFITYSSNTSRGVGTMYVSGFGNYKGGKIFQFYIGGTNINRCSITLSQYSYQYTGYEIRPTVTVTNGLTTVAAYDYDVTYKNNVSSGNATVVVTGKNGYSGTKEINFSIGGKDLNTCTATLSQESYIADGYAKTPSVTVRNGLTTLTQNVDYTISYQNNQVAGTASLIIAGKGGYSGSIVKTFKIIGTPQTITTEFTRYTKYLSSDDFTIRPYATGDGTGFSFTSSDTSVVKVTSFGNVTVVGTGVATITVKTIGVKKSEPVEKVITVTVKPNKAVYTVTSPSYSKMKVRITKAPGVTKYQIRYGRNGNYKNSYYTYSNSSYDTQSKTFTGLRSGSKYYVKVRAYKTMADGQKAWGNWGTIKAVRIK